ncbi:MAG: hypothetical protein CVV02_11140 [Firmicutes bacterium HGW-Firmicutes-7]|nr:MAG: hypothetical protein CVV02_11140 [Firmicutes bacterium HGW-Firmicutes-7]
MNKNNGSNKKIYQIVLMVAISLMVLFFIMKLYSRETSQGVELSNLSTDSILSEAVTYYNNKVGNEGSDNVEAVKKNFGCHYEIYIYNNGELDMRLSYSRGKFYEL